MDIRKRRFNRVAVLKGGISSERAVSLHSGAAVAQGLREGGYHVIEIDVKSKALWIPQEVEAVFVALHGEFGEDGEIQQQLVDLGVPFTGSKPAASRISFDKTLSRQRLAAHGVPIPKGEVLKTADKRTLPLPVMVKSPRQGSSIGCHRVCTDTEWEEAFSDAARYSGDVLVEEYIAGREFTVGVVETEALPVVEIIVPGSEWYNYTAKYGNGGLQYDCPADLAEGVPEILQSIALKTFNFLEAEGFGRVDFRVSTENKPYVLELNTIPGFTAASLLPKAAQTAGIGFPALCCRIMEQAHL